MSRPDEWVTRDTFLEQPLLKVWTLAPSPWSILVAAWLKSWTPLLVSLTPSFLSTILRQQRKLRRRMRNLSTCRGTATPDRRGSAAGLGPNSQQHAKYKVRLKPKYHHRLCSWLCWLRQELYSAIIGLVEWQPTFWAFTHLSGKLTQESNKNSMQQISFHGILFKWATMIVFQPGPDIHAWLLQVFSLAPRIWGESTILPSAKLKRKILEHCTVVQLF